MAAAHFSASAMVFSGRPTERRTVCPIASVPEKSVAARAEPRTMEGDLRPRSAVVMKLPEGRVGERHALSPEQLVDACQLKPLLLQPPGHLLRVPCQPRCRRCLSPWQRAGMISPEEDRRASLQAVARRPGRHPGLSRPRCSAPPSLPTPRSRGQLPSCFRRSASGKGLVRWVSVGLDFVEDELSTPLGK